LVLAINESSDDSWIVRIADNHDPDDVATRYGFKNNGVIPFGPQPDVNYYLFQLHEDHRSERESAKEKIKALLHSKEIIFSQELFKKNRHHRL